MLDKKTLGTIEEQRRVIRTLSFEFKTDTVVILRFWGSHCTKHATWYAAGAGSKKLDAADQEAIAGTPWMESVGEVRPE